MRRLLLVAVLLPGCAGFYRSTEAYQACEEKNREYHRRSGRDYTDADRDKFCVRFAKENESQHYGEGETHTHCNTYGNSTNCRSTTTPIAEDLSVPLMK